MRACEIQERDNYIQPPHHHHQQGLRSVCSAQRARGNTGHHFLPDASADACGQSQTRNRTRPRPASSRQMCSSSLLEWSERDLSSWWGSRLGD
eukprot:scaffold1042_cov146-Isochrysis_galbana.AAC.1